MDNSELRDINNDELFFFLLIVANLISFYIVLEKKKSFLNQESVSYENLNNLFQFKIFLVIIIDIYFVINAYNSLVEIKKREDYDDSEYDTQMIVLVSNVLLLISALLYIPIKDSKYVLTR